MATKSPYTNVSKEHYVHLKFTVTCHIYPIQIHTYIHTRISQKKKERNCLVPILLPHTLHMQFSRPSRQ